VRPISKWAHLMSSTVQVAAVSSRDGYGKPTYSDETVTYRAHINRRPMMVRNTAGEEVRADASIYLASADLIDPAAQVTLSTQDAGSTEDTAVHPLILSVERRYDQRGPHHTVLHVGFGVRSA